VLNVALVHVAANSSFPRDSTIGKATMISWLTTSSQLYTAAWILISSLIGGMIGSGVKLLLSILKCLYSRAPDSVGGLRPSVMADRLASALQHGRPVVVPGTRECLLIWKIGDVEGPDRPSRKALPATQKIAGRDAQTRLP
jgi:hypothetical protein